MRISSSALHQQGLNNILLNQTQLARTQNELSLGVKIQTAGSDPGNWARAARIDEQIAQLDRYKLNNSQLQHRLGLEESALNSASQSLNRVRELAIQGNNAHQSSDALASISQEMLLRLDELVSIANSSDGAGRYLFAGTADGAPPFSLAAVGANYSGNNTVRLVDIADERRVAMGDSGERVFQNLDTGNGTFDVAVNAANTGSAALSQAKVVDLPSYDGDTYTVSFNAGNYEVRDGASALVSSGPYVDGGGIAFRGIEVSFTGAPSDGDNFTVAPSGSQDMFEVIQNMAALLQDVPPDAASRARQQTEFFSALQGLDNALSRISEVRSTVGHRLSSVDDAIEHIEVVEVNARTNLSGIRDVDYAEAVTRLNFQLTAMQAAQQSYNRIQGLSLFDFIS